ncbi:hypothetical protein LBMAG48_24690 [Phycisphaerae bacterium]|nr:hypothetical protein LBMAG48_24690 [Phycisphaerae bacterium]
MTLRELLENANLAGLGLLDQDDQIAFEKALAIAPESVRRHVIAEQARWSGGGELLPAVQPDASLRHRVIDAVNVAIVDAELAQSDAHMELVETGHRRRSGSIWRATSLGLLTACIVLTGSFLYVVQSNKAVIAGNGNNQALGEYVYGFGSEFTDAIFDPATKRIFLTANETGFEGRISIFSHPDWQKGRAFAESLPARENENYRLVELDANNHVVRELATFDGGVQTQTREVVKINTGSRVALVIVAVNAPATADRVLLIGTA